MMKGYESSEKNDETGAQKESERPIKDDAPVAWGLERTSQRPPNEPSGQPKHAAEVVRGVMHASPMCMAATM